MLKNIPSILPPELLKILAEMGHGDEIVLADANFPAARLGARCVRCDGHGMPALLDAVLQLLPLDSYVPQPAALMQVVPGDDVVPAIWDTYAKVIARHDARAAVAGFDMVERFAFYERAEKAFAVVQSGEGALYANIILKKGVLTP